jgi:hypothetical protein
MPNQPENQQSTSQIKALLQKISDIRHQDDAEFSPLMKCQEKAKEISSSLTDKSILSHEDYQTIKELEALVSLVSSENLSNEDYEKSEDLVRNAFEVPMRKAISYNKLFFVTQNPLDPAILEKAADLEVSASQELAISILKSVSFNQSEPLIKLLESLLQERSWGLALHLACCLEYQNQSNQKSIPSWLIRFFILSREVIHDFGYEGIYERIANTLEKDIHRLEYYSTNEAKDQAWNLSMNLLQVAAILRPALLAPNTKAASIARIFNFDTARLHSLSEFCRLIAQYGEDCRPLNFEDLQGTNQDTEWKKKIEELQQKAYHWFQNEAPAKKMTFAPATYVWKNWLSHSLGTNNTDKEGLIYSLLRPVINTNKSDNEADDLNQIKRRVRELSSDGEVEKRVDYTDKEVLKRRKGNDRRIRHTAFQQIRTHLNEALGFAREWIRLQELKPTDQGGFNKQKVEELKSSLFELKEKAIDELTHIKSDAVSSDFFLFSVDFFKESIENVLYLFSEKYQHTQTEPEVKHILYVDLLKIPKIAVNEQWVPVNEESSYGDPDVLKKIIQLIAEPKLDWVQVFDEHDELGSHDSTNRILEYLRVYPDSSTNFKELESRRNIQLNDWQNKLRQEIYTTRVSVEDVFVLASTFSKPDERNENIDTIDIIENDIEKVTRFSDSIGRLQEIQRTLKARKEDAVRVFQKRLNGLGLSKESNEYKLISKELEDGDIFAADGHISILENREEIPISSSSEHSSKKSFSEALEDIANCLGKSKKENGFSKVIQAINQRKEFAGIRFSGIRRMSLETAIKMLETWSKITKSKKIDEEQARTILEHLGFQPRTIEIAQLTNRVDLKIETVPLQEKDFCPVAVYGSDARGHYRIICIWDQPTEESLYTTSVESAGVHECIMVFRFGSHLRSKVRSKAAELSHKYRRTYIMVDDLLMVYLCGEPGLRLPIFFESTLPFTFVNPYTITAGIVPPEIFYGRGEEIRSIVDINGSCFIYGGRQLGKTALLRHVERTHHKPTEGQIVLWLDLKAQGIGTDKGVDEIWNLLREKLYQLGVLSRLTSGINVDTLLNNIEKWLTENKQRTILLLLDEADRFLEADGAATREGEFIRTSYIKGLMDSTNRRFKVVFAGLHNVQRTTSLSNHPLAHCGYPLCIGPLLKGEDLRAAKDLIKRPLAAIGYRIPDNLVTRILSQTNYYPSLVQLYCVELLRHVRSNGSGGYFSREITSKHVDDAYRSQRLRTAIQERLRWTLQLDLRYEVIAYAIAYLLIGNQDEDKVFSVEEVLEEVKCWWTEGFKGTSNYEIRILLQEMVGLGVLKEVLAGDGSGTKVGFALRSLNLRLLMGTTDEIEAALLKEREPSLTYDPATFRPAFSQTLDRRSPLTAQQESDLRSRENAVTVIFGCYTAGLDEIQDYLQSKLSKNSDGSFFSELLKSDTKEHFNIAIDKLKEREQGGTTILLVPASCLWDKQWIESALARIQKFTSKDKFAHVVFIADPKRTWDLVQELEDLLYPVPERVKLFSLKPWHDAALRQWLEDCEVVMTDGKLEREKIAKITGSWHSLLNRFFGYLRENKYRLETAFAQLEHLFTNMSLVQEIAYSFGIDEVADDRRRVLSAFADIEKQENGSISENDLIEWLDVIDENFQGNQMDIERVLRWAELLSLVEEKTPGYWEVNPTVSRILESLQKNERS